MNCHLIDTFSLREIEQRKGVLVDGVHAARADQPHQMQGATVALDLTACAHQRGIGVEAPLGDGRRDAYQILHHDAARAEIEVSDFAVPHLPLGQTDAQPGCFEQRARPASPERIPRRGVS